MWIWQSFFSIRLGKIFIAPRTPQAVMPRAIGERIGQNNFPLRWEIELEINPSIKTLKGCGGPDGLINVQVHLAHLHNLIQRNYCTSKARPLL